MKLLVALLLGLAAFSYADDDSDEVATFDHDDDDLPVLPLMKVSHQAAAKAPIPATFAQVRSVPSPAAVNLPTPVAHGTSSSPAVMKIPKPGIKFNIPQPQTHISSIPVEAAVPVPAAPQPIQMVMPKTTLKSVKTIPAIPTPVATLKTPAAPIPVTMKTAATPVSIPEPMTHFMPMSTLKAAEIPSTPVRHMMPATMFRHNIQSLPMPYYSSSINYGYPRVLDVPSAPIQSTFIAPQERITLPAAIPISTDSVEVETMPIQYTTASDITAIPTANMPYPAGSFQTNIMETPQALNYWADFQTPQQIHDFMDLSNGGFSFINVIGGRSSVPVVTKSQSMMEVGPLFKDIHSQIPKVNPIMDAKATTATAAAAEPQNTGVIAA